MDDSIITILVVVTLGIFQLVMSINKKKRAQEQALRSRLNSVAPDSELEVLEELEKMFYPIEKLEQPVPVLQPKVEGVPMAKPIPVVIEEEALECPELLSGFTPQKAIIFSEILNPKWNS